MQVRKTSGKQAGLIVDLSQDAAEAEIAFGTAERVDELPVLSGEEEVAVPVSESEPKPKTATKKKVAKKKRSKKSAS